ncbi:MAG TPA: ATP-binding cassette domain-containing protein, partial [Candidatus Binatus sp.]|nr:ATP-binding cassette domain-containing protein [Candidatus Binatus sp.]
MTTAAAAPPALEMRGITKRYPGVIANDRIDLTVLPGEIHALLGENGAGKTTLMNVLYGLARPDEGQILLDGQVVRIADPSDAIARGIDMVHQHFMLVPVLTPQETEEIFAVLKRLAAEGHSIIFISHKLYEVLEIADRITVIRRGRVVGERRPAETTEDDLAELMVGREVELTVDRGESHPKGPMLNVADLRARDDRGNEVVHGVDLEVRAGEIVGIAGVAGNGQDELVEAIVGLRRPSGGRVSLGGDDVTGQSPRQMNEAAVAYVPADRQRFGLILSFPLSDNLVLTGYYRSP